MSTDTVFHVSATRGDDELGDGSIEAPFATLERALDACEPGNQVRFNETPPEPDLRTDSGWIILAAVLSGTTVGYMTGNVVSALIGAVAVSVLFVWLETRAQR